MGRERAVCLPIADLPVSQGTRGSEAFIPLFRSCGSGAEESDLCQHLRETKMKVLVIPIFILLQLLQFQVYIFT